MKKSYAMRELAAQTSWDDTPAQAPAAEGKLDVGGARIWYWDTGGAGEAVVLVHPYSGSALNWGYQQPALSAAGYRVVAYSRRGHHGSDAGSSENPGTGAGDLHQLAEHLGIGRMHLVGLAAGADILPDFAISRPERLLSLVIGCTIGKPGDPAWSARESELLPPEVRNLPRWISELGPSYRAACPEGVKRWRELEARSRTRAGTPARSRRKRSYSGIDWANQGAHAAVNRRCGSVHAAFAAARLCRVLDRSRSRAVRRGGAFGLLGAIRGLQCGPARFLPASSRLRSVTVGMGVCSGRRKYIPVGFGLGILPRTPAAHPHAYGD